MSVSGASSKPINLRERVEDTEEAEPVQTKQDSHHLYSFESVRRNQSLKVLGPSRENVIPPSRERMSSEMYKKLQPHYFIRRDGVQTTVAELAKKRKENIDNKDAKLDLGSLKPTDSVESSRLNEPEWVKSTRFTKTPELPSGNTTQLVRCKIPPESYRQYINRCSGYGSSVRKIIEGLEKENLENVVRKNALIATFKSAHSPENFEGPNPESNILKAGRSKKLHNVIQSTQLPDFYYD